MQGKEINIVFATDEGYARQTCIAMQTVIECGKTCNKYIFWILCEEKQKGDLTDYFTSINEKYVNCEINYLDTSGYFASVPLPIAHITKPTYYRLLIPSLLNLERCIYLDSDIIVCDDIEGLYSISLEGYEVAGVIAAGYPQSYSQTINIPSMDTYINAGVLVMNLKEMRRSNFTEKAIAMSGTRYSSSDQDIINILSYGKIKLLPLAYNYQPSCVGKIDLEEIFGKEDVINAGEKPQIVHYLTLYKPWEFLNIKYADKWWEACRRTPYFSYFFNRYHKVFYYYGIIANQDLWQVKQGTDLWYGQLNKFSEIYLYGAGKYARRVIEAFKKRGIALAGIYVSNLEKNPRELDGIKVECFSGTVNKGGIILIAARPVAALEIYRMFLERNFYDFYFLDEDILLN